MSDLQQHEARRGLCALGILIVLTGSSCTHRRQASLVPDRVTPVVAKPEPAPAQSAEALFQQGLRFEIQGEYEKAADAFTQAIGATNDYYPAWLHRGRVEMLRRQPAAGLMYLEVAVRLRPEDAQALHWRGDVHLQTGEPSSAIADYDRALELERDKLELAAIHTARADAYLLIQEEGRALADYSNAIRLWPGNAEPYLRRGLLLQKKGRLQEAIQDFHIAAMFRPDSDEVKNALLQANLLLPAQPAAVKTAVAQTKSLPEVKAPPTPPVAPAPSVAAASPPVVTPAAKTAVQGTPAAQPLASTSAAANMRAAQQRWHSALSMIYGKEEGRAIEELNEALQLRPKFAEAYNARGFAYLLLRDYARAIADFDEALRISPNYANAIHNRDVAAKSLERSSKIAARAAPASSVGAAFSSARSAADRWRNGMELIQSERFEEAVQQLDRAIELNPTYAQAFNARGFAWLKMRQYQRAITDFDRALQLSPNYANATHNRTVAIQVSQRVTVGLTAR